jgi:hypothetical protein
MKTIKQLFLLSLLFIGNLGFSQTPEQQKMIDKAIKMRDSIMQCITIQEILQKANEQEKRFELDKQTQKNETSPITIVKKKLDKYWENTLVSDSNNTFKGWNNGEADLVFNYKFNIRNDKIDYVKVGIIKADGTIVLNPTKEIPILEPLNEYKSNNKFFDIHNPDSYQLINGETGFKLNSYLLVYQNEQQIGILTIGNSAKVTLNLLTLGDLYFGDQGYILSWVYVNEACAIKANENWKGDLSNTDTPLLVETNVVYDLSFKPGWNLVKTEIIGKYEFINVPEEDKSRYKRHEHTMVTSIPNDASYFFRKSQHY